MFRLNVKITEQENDFLVKKSEELQISKAGYVRVALDQLMSMDQARKSQPDDQAGDGG